MRAPIAEGVVIAVADQNVAVADVLDVVGLRPNRRYLEPSRRRMQPTGRLCRTHVDDGDSAVLYGRADVRRVILFLRSDHRAGGWQASG